GGILSADGEWKPGGNEIQPRRVAVVIGPQYGPITGGLVESCIRAAFRSRLYQDLVFAGFSFDAAAQTIIQEVEREHLQCHLAFKGLIDKDKIASLGGTVSQPFDPPKGKEPRVAVKVIDPRGNEVMRILPVPREV